MAPMNTVQAGMAAGQVQKPVALAPASQTFGGGSLFSTVLDAVNPLQHIPIVSNIYRAATGSSISAVSQVAGDTLYGGLLGGAVSSLITSVADVAVKEASGQGITEHVLSLAENNSAPAGGKTTALVPSAVPLEVPPQAINAQEEKQASLIEALKLRHDRVAAQYQRAQTLDIANGLLAKAV